MNNRTFVIGVDIGGTNTKIGVVSEDGKIIFKNQIPTDSRLGTARCVDRICQCVSEIIKKAHSLVVQMEISIETIKEIYDKLREIKQKFRNPLIHGLTGESELLIPVLDLGIVPFSYKYFSENISNRYILIKPEEVSYIMEIFQKFFDYIREVKPYKYYYLYCEAGFAIPINEEDLIEIREKMTSIEEFKEYLEYRSYLEDKYFNMD